jgi:hypothetical protein
MSEDRIYLQCYENDDEVTWCDTRINGSDVEYVRADLHRQGWIDADLVLPEQFATVLVAVLEDDEVYHYALGGVGYGGEWVTTWNNTADRVTHWMPLPPLPETI